MATRSRFLPWQFRRGQSHQGGGIEAICSDVLLSAQLPLLLMSRAVEYLLPQAPPARAPSPPLLPCAARVCASTACGCVYVCVPAAQVWSSYGDAAAAEGLVSSIKELAVADLAALPEAERGRRVGARDVV